MKSSSIMHVFFEVNMKNGHNRLAEILKKERKAVTQGEFALFINRDWTACKLLTSGEIILHLKRPKNKPINPKTIPYLPSCVSGSKLNYNRALEQVIKKEYDKNYEEVE